MAAARDALAMPNHPDAVGGVRTSSGEGKLCVVR